MPLNRRLWRPGIRPPSVAPRTLYFDGSYDEFWHDLRNWWNDENHTDQATSLPKSVDTVIVTDTSIDTEEGSEPTVANFTLNDPSNGYSLFGPLTVTGVATFNGVSSNLSTSLTGNAVFNADSYNGGTINGNATFNDDSFSDAGGTVTGNGVFNNNSFNEGTVSGDAVFNGFSQHNFGATVGGNATFNDSATNEGLVSGDATFNNDSNNTGDVTGTATFNDSACNRGGTAGTFVPNPPPNCDDL
jgi:hypothetical protein